MDESVMLTFCSENIVVDIVMLKKKTIEVEPFDC